MALHVGDTDGQNLQPTHLDNVESNTLNDARVSRYTPSPGHPPTTDLDNDDANPLFRSDATSKEPHSTEWPVQSQQVATVTPLRASLLVFDAILASTPLMFVSLALTAARLDGKSISDYGDGLEQTLLLSPTIFPLIFAALMGRFFRHLGVYLAERGTTLGRLEQLIGCQSVFTALERQIVLRSWSVVGLLSVLVWLLSPVGGQSALRLLGQERKFVSSTAMVRYLDPQAATDTVLGSASGMNSARPTYTSIFLSALLSSSKYQDTSMDLWGNVKLPLYREIESFTPDVWKPVSDGNGNNTTYGSLIGVPTVGMLSDGLSNFSIKARQFDVTCSRNEWKSGSHNDSLWANMTSTWRLAFDESRTNKTMGNEYPLPLLSLSQVNDDSTGSNFSVASCSVTLNYLEAKVHCNGTSCGVTSMRKLPLLSDGYTAGLDAFTRGVIFNNLMGFLPTVDNYAVGAATARGSTNAEKWIADPSDFIGSTYSNVELYKLDPQLFSRRLTILLNTFYQSTFATIAIGGTLPKNVVQTGVLLNQAGNALVTFNATRAETVRQTALVYRTNWKWLAALLVCSFLLLVAAYVGLVLKYLTLAPDIIGYASSLTLLNPYVPVSTGASTLHGLERAALLHDLPIRIGDVAGDEPVGAIAFGKADEGRVARLTRRRWYI